MLVGGILCVALDCIETTVDYVCRHELFHYIHLPVVADLDTAIQKVTEMHGPKL